MMSFLRRPVGILVVTLALLALAGVFALADLDSGTTIALVAAAVIYTIVIVYGARRESLAEIAEYTEAYGIGHAREHGRQVAWNTALLAVSIAVIVVGADNEYIPKLFGYETAPTMDDALYKAKNGEMKSLDITCLHVPPIVMGDVTL